MNILIPHNWLTEYLRTSLKPKEIAQRFSLGGVSVERVERVPAGLSDQKDYVYDIEVTSNRPDMLSILGIAREGAAILEKDCLVPVLPTLPRVEDVLPLNITIREPSLCRRYLGIVLQDIEVKPSPRGIQERLKQGGLRPINNVVDITNYVMLEYGQPLHAFDADLLAKTQNGTHEIIVRRAAREEEFMTLDRQHFSLNPKTLVIADPQGPLALAGIKGGAKAEVSEQTKCIILECANFEPLNIRETSRALALQTDASTRFDKGLAPIGLEFAFGRAIDLLQKFAHADLACNPVDAYPKPLKPKIISFDFATVKRVLGAQIPPVAVKNILLRLGFKIRGNGQAMRISVPYWRYDDIDCPEDFVEEVARIYGYHRFPGKLLEKRLPAEVRTAKFIQEDKVKDVLASQGFLEVYTYSFVSEDLARQRGSAPLKHLRVTNPLSQDFVYLRRALLPSVLAVVKQNAKKFETVKVFELNHIYTGKKIPYERRRLVAVWFAKRGSLEVFYQMKGVLENLFTALGIMEYRFVAEGETRSSVQVQGEKVGICGLVSAPFLSARDYLFAFDLDFEKLSSLIRGARAFQPIPKYPAVALDLAIIVGKKVLWQDLEATILKTNSLIETVTLFDVYQGRQIGPHKKSVALRIAYRSPKRSLEEEEAKKIQAQVLEKLQSKFQARLRS